MALPWTCLPRLTNRGAPCSYSPSQTSLLPDLALEALERQPLPLQHVQHRVVLFFIVLPATDILLMDAMAMVGIYRVIHTRGVPSGHFLVAGTGGI